jgi:hypothetical protein
MSCRASGIAETIRRLAVLSTNAAHVFFTLGLRPGAPASLVILGIENRINACRLRRCLYRSCCGWQFQRLPKPSDNCHLLRPVISFAARHLPGGDPTARESARKTGL